MKTGVRILCRFRKSDRYQTLWQISCQCFVQPRMIVPALIEQVKNKIRIISHIGWVHGDDSLVLGALDYGTFKNPPVHIAKLFH